MILEKDWLTLPKDALIRIVVAQQWMVAISIFMCAKPKYPYVSFVIEAQLPTAEQYINEWIALRQKDI